MVFKLLCFAVLCALWWGSLWFALPVDWLQGTMPSFIAVHVAPPLLAVSAWWMGKWAWVWRGKRAKKRAEEAVEAGKKAAHEAAEAAHKEKMELRHAHVECRAVWAAVVKTPDWYEEGAEQCLFLEQAPETIQGAMREVALVTSLKQVFEAAFMQCEASLWLPMVFDTDDTAHSDRAGQSWHQAISACGIARFPQRPDFLDISGEGELPDRLIALFEREPGLPAVILIGMDSPLADAYPPDESDFDSKPKPKPKPKPGHAVVAVLLSRPGLTAPDRAAHATGEDNADPMTPFWEREQLHGADLPQWQRIPPPLRPGLWDLAPFAMLRRSSTASRLEPKRDSVLTRQIREAIHEASIHAGLRDLPFKPEEAGEEAQAKPVKPEPPVEPEPLDLGWFVHNSGTVFRFAALTSALRDCGCEIDPFIDAGNLEKEFGDVGAAGSALMLAEGLIRVAQLQKPVLIAKFNEEDSIEIWLVRPAPETPPTETV